MNVLYLAHTCPYPPNRGDRIRCYHILKHLASRYKVTLVYPVFTDEHHNCQSALLEYCSAVFPVHQSRLMAYFHCFLALFGSTPLSVAFFRSRRLRRIVRTLSFNAIVVDCSTMAQYAMGLPYHKILDFVDIDSQKWKLFSEMNHFPHSLLYKIESDRLARFERALSQEFDYCLVTSQYEKSLLGDIPHMVVLPNGVDRQYFSGHNTPTPGKIIFTGVMDYFPNTDAVVHFHDRIFPLIKQEIPAAQFVIAGMHPTAQVRRLASADTVVTGFVPDIRDYLSRATVCVVPLRLAMGVQNKILEAMAMGVPVVATSIANRGINAEHGRDLLIADDTEGFATATIQLLKNPSLREAIVKNAQEFIEQHFSWEKNLHKLDALMSEILNQLPKPSDSSRHRESSLQ